MSRRRTPPVIPGDVPERHWNVPDLPPEPASKRHRRKRATVSDAVRARVYAKDNYRCVNCLATRDLSIDHIIPVSHGGENSPSNMQTMCVRCNNAKADNLPPSTPKAKQQDGSSAVGRAWLTLLGGGED